MGRPDYVPGQWDDAAANGWTARKPSRVLVFFAFFLTLDVAVLAWIVADPGFWAHHPGGYVAIPIATAMLVYQVVKYGPRAWRAMLNGRR